MPITYPAQWSALGRWKNVSWRSAADQGGGGPWVRDCSNARPVRCLMKRLQSPTTEDAMML